MKHNAFVKFLAVVLAVISAVGLILGGITVFCNLNWSLYTNSPADYQEERVYWHSQDYAQTLAEELAFADSRMSMELWYQFFSNGYLNRSYWPYVDYVLVDDAGNSTELSNHNQSEYVYETMVSISLRGGSALKIGENGQYYPQYAPDWAGEYDTLEPTSVTVPYETTESDEAVISNTTPTEATEPEEDIWDTDYFTSYTTDEGDIYMIYRNDRPSEYDICLFYTQDDIDNVTGGSYTTSALGLFLYEHRYDAIWLTLISAAVLILMMVYLGFAAGRKPDSDEVKPAGLNKLPLDLYTGLACFLGFWPVWALLEPVMGSLFELEKLSGEVFWLLMIGAVATSAAIGLICVLYWMAFWAQINAGSGYWWRNSLLGRFGKSIWNFLLRCFRKLFVFLTGMGGKVGEKLPSVTELLRDFNDKLPLVGQWLAASLVMFALLAFCGSLCWHGLGMAMYVAVVILCLVAILYGVRGFGQLRDAAKRMSQGSLDVKINPDALEGCFKDFARDLNALSDACVTAAREQLKSERMRTELITNVSHDIKTPLTSIINYVDLLQHAQTEEERRQYLEVLERQSQRLKKLIEDLMEMSKASSGNVAMELAPTDVVESVNQALGEYADRFDAQGLNVVFRTPGESVMALCDGKLLWRVMSNVMVNIVKYAMPGTRVYIDLSVTEFKVQLALKNISREELNISAEELMERFVRGDESRNTEGNGLGLNIAKSLMEVQGGALELVVDGDLFKVVLTLPKAE